MCAEGCCEGQYQKPLHNKGIVLQYIPFYEHFCSVFSTHTLQVREDNLQIKQVTAEYITALQSSQLLALVASFSFKYLCSCGAPYSFKVCCLNA